MVDRIYWTSKQKNTQALSKAHTQVFSLPIPAAKSGDLITALCTQEFTNDANFDPPFVNVVFAYWEMFLSQTPHDTASAGLSLVIGSQPGTNVLPAVHHYKDTCVGALIVPPIPIVKPWNVIYSVYWDATPGNLPGLIHQGKGYGSLFVRITPAGEFSL